MPDRRNSGVASRQQSPAAERLGLVGSVRRTTRQDHVIGNDGSKLTWNQNVASDFAQRATAAFSEKAQGILDDVLRDAGGQDAATVRAMLRSRWQSEMGQLPEESLLNKFANRLAAGQRVVVKQTGTYSD